MRLIPPVPIPNSSHSGPVPQGPWQGAYHPPSHHIRATHDTSSPAAVIALNGSIPRLDRFSMLDMEIIGINVLCIPRAARRMQHALINVRYPTPRALDFFLIGCHHRIRHTALLR